MKDKWARKIMTKCFAFKRYGDENKKSKCTKIWNCLVANRLENKVKYLGKISIKVESLKEQNKEVLKDSAKKISYGDVKGEKIKKNNPIYSQISDNLYRILIVCGSG